MIIERDQNGKRHVPTRRSGCYYGRMEDCCTLCAWRLFLVQIAGLLRIGTDRTVRGHERVGPQVLVPTISGADDCDAVDHASGKVTEIHDVEQARDAFTVRLDDGETLAVTIERID